MITLMLIVLVLLLVIAVAIFTWGVPALIIAIAIGDLVVFVFFVSLIAKIFKK